MTDLIETININGPFWSARVRVIQLANPRTHRAFRNLYVSASTRRAFDETQVQLPGTMLILCAPQRVRVEPSKNSSQDMVWRRPSSESIPNRPTLAEIADHLRTGRLSLLLVQTLPGQWPREADTESRPNFTCIGGEINLARLNDNGDRDRLYETLDLTLPNDEADDLLTAHASGLSLRGMATLPWESDAIAAPFLLARLQPDPAPAKPGFRLSIDQDLLTENEEKAIVQAWQRLSKAINPAYPLHEGPLPPNEDLAVWTTLEIVNPLAVPQLYWQISPWEPPPSTGRPVQFERGEVNLILSDQQVYDQDHPPTTLGRVVPDEFSITAQADSQLTIAINTGESTNSAGSWHYEATKNGADWAETVRVSEVDLAFDIVEVAQSLRQQQGLPEPIWIPNDTPLPLKEPRLWGFMRLDDGWAQLPIPNLTEQIYLDAKLALTDPEAEPANLVQGAVAIGNNEPAVLNAHPEEQPWQVTLLNFASLSGTWTLSSDLAITSIQISVSSPNIIVDGLFWLSTGQPTIADALPDLDNWVSGLSTFILGTIDPERDLFPAPIRLQLHNLQFMRRGGMDGPISPQLTNWSFSYHLQQGVMDTLQERGVLDSEAFSTYLPLVWQRHPWLPMVQALPLTQSQTPPNVPIASRQLAPFELPADDDWRFAAANDRGAAAWAKYVGLASPAKEWVTALDLPMVALSLPGLILDPGTSSTQTGLPPDSATLLPIQYRHDLPYTDEVNALAQLPEQPRDPDEVSPLPDSVPPQPPQPLTRETLADYWRTLSERASLAAADAVDAFVSNGQTRMQFLVEPYQWTVNATFDLATYPGSMNVKDQDNDSELNLSSDTALTGVSGRFAIIDSTSIKHLPNDDFAEYDFALTAGSMAARIKDQTAQDQRGLHRQSSREIGNLLVTPVRLETTDQAASFIHLTSLKSVIQLDVDDGHTWRFWMRDVPVTQGTFDRATTRSSRAQDINDPEALSREHNFLTGYEWRLMDSDQTDVPKMALFGLDFFPLTLEKITIASGQLTQIEMIGRLQLPLPSNQELTDFSNAVRATFTANESTGLKLSALQLESSMGQWPLSLQSGERTSGPMLQWTLIQFDEAQGITIDQAHLQFTLFGVSWSVPIPPLTFGKVPQQMTITHSFAPSSEPLTLKSLTLILDLTTAIHTASLLVGSRLGVSERPLIEADIRFPILSESSAQASVETATLFNQPNLVIQQQVFTNKTLQLSWGAQALARRAAILPTLEVLPGMTIRSLDVPGFAALTFDIPDFELNGEDRIPKLKLTSCFAETILSAQWGTFLQTTPDASAESNDLTLDQVTGSSAGNLTIGYTTQWVAEDNGWVESGLLNGFVEITNLISWPTRMVADASTATLTLPAARTASESPPTLNHIRHTMRVLFNQHPLPTEHLIVGNESLLFNLAPDKSWQFLAVVEHQLIDILPNSDFTLFTRQQDRRWTTLQEVRILQPDTFREFLMPSGRKTLDPVSGVGSRRRLHGYFRDQVQQDLVAALQSSLPETLIVEASAPHFIKLADPSQDVEANLPPTALQFLPDGSQHAVLSSPADFTPATEETGPWLLLTMPFLGRLQNRINDGLTTPESTSAGSLQVDPVLRLHQLRSDDPSAPLPRLLRILTSWGDDQTVVVTVAELDWPIARSWHRLDPISLEENWFRLQNPEVEPQPQSLQSILAALPDTPARLSRAVALRRAFDAFKPLYPPARPADYQLPAPTTEIKPVWRQDSLFVIQNVERAQRSSDRVYAWHAVGLQIITGVHTDQEKTLRHFAAATLLPAGLRIDDNDNDSPLSFAVSPYLGLEFRPAAGNQPYNPRLVSSELLCIDPVSNTVLPVASQLSDVAGEAGLQRTRAWAKETHRRLVPDSPIAIIRQRHVNEREDQRDRVTVEQNTTATITVSYTFNLITDLQITQPLSALTAPLRSAIKTLHFREGQFGGTAIPEGLMAFELAPPQTTGVQPIYINKIDAASTANSPASNWPWGVSALRYAVQYTAAQQAIIGPRLSEVTNENHPTLWWQAPQHQIQYRSAQRSTRPVAGLPPLFRGSAIKGFLPILPKPPMPLNTQDHFSNGGTGWQPVLPGCLHYMLLGTRPGTMLAIRNQLIKHRLADIVVSGSIPAQHRVPRPVSLPTNDQREKALQPWASYFEPMQNLAVQAAPLDEAFFAACGPRSARRLQMRLTDPMYGALPANWSGELTFEIMGQEYTETTSVDEDQTTNSAPLSWLVTLELLIENQVFAFESNSSTQVEATNGPFVFTLAEDSLKTANDLLGGKASGDTVYLQAKVKPSDTTDNFYQTLKFPLRIIAGQAIILPLRPAFIHFEDPEYNRRLASPSANLSKAMKIELIEIDQNNNEVTIETLHKTLKLSADRREYNPTSQMAIRYDWDDAGEANPIAMSTAKLEIAKVNPEGVPTPLTLIKPLEDGFTGLEDIAPGTLIQFSLLDLRLGEREPKFATGDTLQLKLTVTTASLSMLPDPPNNSSRPSQTQDGDSTEIIFLTVDIVAEPVIPVPEAAYGLLRWQTSNGQTHTECARFAWAPQPSRIELVCPDDLLSEVVRRRAVFQWTDAVRPATQPGYAVQKITQTGSTHFPSPTRMGLGT